MVDTTPIRGRKILVSVEAGDLPGGQESFRVTVHDGTAAIAGASPRGVLYGVYGLLERLGCGFFLSSETVPVKQEPFSFRGWAMEDQPLFADRIVFDWHNFLSSASG